jgi:putative membrane protein insertion efficiency factor
VLKPCADAARIDSSGWLARRRRLAVLFVALLVAGVGLDASRAPERQWTTALAVRAIHVYQRTLSPALGACGLGCRFTPTCSRYVEAVLRTHGIVAGSWRALGRIIRCGPWTPAGTVDRPN